VPWLQVVQAAGEVAVAAVRSTVPGLHAPATTQVTWLTPVEKLPFAQGEHHWSLESEPAVATCSPATQVVHAVQDAALTAELKVPLAQPAQVRSLVELPVAVWYWPAAQVVHGVHWPAAANVPAGHRPVPPSARPALPQPARRQTRAAQVSGVRRRDDEAGEGVKGMGARILHPPYRQAPS
jgi:hypothetical protein